MNVGRQTETRSPCILVTGGASGIGAAIVRVFSASGARIAVIDSNKAALDLLVASIGQVEAAFPVDVRDARQCKQAICDLESRWGRIDVLVNNAGISRRAGLPDITETSWREVLDVNLTAPFMLSQAVAPGMLAVGAGCIINIASVSGMVGMPNYASYNVSKAGLIELTRTLALELAPKIRVNAICPGYVLTPMQEAEYTPDQIAQCADRLPVGRLGRPDEIAHLASYLASPLAGYVTGQSYVIDGGETAGGLASQC